MSKAVEYFKNLQNILERIITEQYDNIEAASVAVADTLKNGGRIHTFGTGHSHMLAEEIFYRAGGLVNVNPILESSLMLMKVHQRARSLNALKATVKFFSVTIQYQIKISFFFSQILAETAWQLILHLLRRKEASERLLSPIWSTQ